MAEVRFWVLIFLGLFVQFVESENEYNVNLRKTSFDVYHSLHIPRDPPLYPTYNKVPKTSFTCEGRKWGYYADPEAQCQVYHLCQEKLVVSFLCPNSTLFHDQFKACDQYYNVRCGSHLEDL